MGMTVVCQACGARRTLPASLYDSRVRGRVATFPAKTAGAAILVDGTVPPPAGTDADVELPAVVIPKAPSLPDVEPGDDATDGRRAARKAISHADGPISERGPSARIAATRCSSNSRSRHGHGALWPARRRGRLLTLVAIKRLLSALGREPRVHGHAAQRSALAARVRHPNVVATLDVVASKGDVLLVLDSWRARP